MQNFLKSLKTSLKDGYSEAEINTFGYLLLEKLTRFSKTQLLADKSLKLSDNQQELAAHYIERLAKHEPIQYILGETEFYGLKFKVNPSVLIPRPETEELVEWVINSLPADSSQKKHLLDIGTGSGCIAVSLKKKLPDLHVSAMDVSVVALALAKENAILNNVTVDFIQDDILNPASTERKWDVIVSNPPYIPISEIKEMDKNVTDFEPHLALFVEDGNPLIFYQKIAAFAKNHLLPDGSIYFETHKDLAVDVAKMLENNGFLNVEIRKDMSGNERMVRGSLA